MKRRHLLLGVTAAAAGSALAVPALAAPALQPARPDPLWCYRTDPLWWPRTLFEHGIVYSVATRYVNSASTWKLSVRDPRHVLHAPWSREIEVAMGGLLDDVLGDCYGTPQGSVTVRRRYNDPGQQQRFDGDPLPKVRMQAHLLTSGELSVMFWLMRTSPVPPPDGYRLEGQTH